MGFLVNGPKLMSNVVQTIQAGSKPIPTGSSLKCAGHCMTGTRMMKSGYRTNSRGPGAPSTVIKPWDICNRRTKKV